MKRITMSFAAALDYKPEHPERTARKQGTGMNFDVTFQTWTNRPAMARTIRMQESAGNAAWKACVPLSPGEGY